MIPRKKLHSPKQLSSGVMGKCQQLSRRRFIFNLIELLSENIFVE